MLLKEAERAARKKKKQKNKEKTQGRNGLWENSICMVSKRRQIEFCQACSAMINNFSNFHAILHRAAEETQDDTSRRHAAQNRCKFKIRTERGPNGKWIFYFFFPYFSFDAFHCNCALCSELRVQSVVWFIHHQRLRECTPHKSNS